MTTVTGGQTRHSLKPGTVFLGFAIFGSIWGLYSAAIPLIMSNTGASESALGIAMMCVALAAAPAMFVTGRLLDRFGRPVVVISAVLFALVATGPTLADSLVFLVVTLLLFGVGSGAFDVVINSMAATVEAERNVRMMNRAHALFSLGLMGGAVSIGIGRSFGVVPWTLLVCIGLLSIVGIVLAARHIPRHISRERPERTGRRRINKVAIGFGLLVALALLVESGIQQWSAVFLEQQVGAPVAISSMAPAIFAGAMVLGRLTGHWISTRTSDRWVLLGAGVVSGLGTLVVSTATSAPVALAGFAIAGGAISVAAPTVYGLVGRRSPSEHRGASIGAASSVGYMGLLLGPAVIGQLAGFFDLRIAFACLTAVSAVLAMSALVAGGSKGTTAPGNG